MGVDLNIHKLSDKTAGIDLSEINMSIRLYNCLRRAGYKTLSDIMAEAPEKFSSIRNLGRASEQELLSIIYFVRNASREEIVELCSNKVTLGCGESTEGIILLDTEISNLMGDISVADYSLGKQIDASSIMFSNDVGDYCEDVGIEKLGISTRTYNALMVRGIISLQRVASMSYQELLHISGLGKKSIDEIVEVVKKRAIIPENDTIHEGEVIKEVVEDIITFFSPIIDEEFLRAKKREIVVLIINIIDKEYECDIKSDRFMTIVARSNPINSLIRNIIKDIVSERIYHGIDERMLLSLATRQNGKYETIVKDILDEMIQCGQVRNISGKLYKYKYFLREWIDTLQGNSHLVLESRCQGRTLEEIGNRIGLTRERVRQLISHTLEKRPELYEDDYKIFIEKYNFEKEEFCRLFDLTLFQINYLLFNYKHGLADIQDFLDDNMVPNLFKDRVPLAFNGKVIVLDGNCVPLKRDELLRILLKTFYSDSECSVKKFEQFYQAFLLENSIADKENLTFPNSRAFEARITDYPYTLMKAGHKIRFYDTEAVDIERLLDSVNILRYQDMEISTLKLMRDWPDVMEQYDIRDEYELHNLIRKRINDIKKYSISVTRMPFITVGEGDRVKQVEDLLLQMAPISNIDLAKVYEERYGVRSETVLANFFKQIDIYYHNGLFDIEQQDLNDNDFNSMQEVLTEDVYIWDEIVKKYRAVSINPKTEAINAMTLKKLGFRVYSQYVIRSNYPSADAYFTSILLRDNCVDLNEFKQGIRSIQAFYVALSNLRDSLELIEVERDLFYRYDYFAEKFSIESKDQLKDIGKSVLSRLDDTEYFSVDALANGLMLEEVPLVNQSTYILNSLIRAQDGYKTSRIANIYLGTKKDNELSQLGLITHIVNKDGDVSMRNLINILNTQYNMILDRSRVLYVIRDSRDVFYDDICDYLVLSTNWSGNIGQVYLSESRFANDIEEKISYINQSDVMIANYYWNDKYAEFVNYCGINDCYLMKDILKLDFRKLSESASKLNISRGTIADIVNGFVEWTKGAENKGEDTECESILDLFFK